MQVVLKTVVLVFSLSGLVWATQVQAVATSGDRNRPVVRKAAVKPAAVKPAAAKTGNGARARPAHVSARKAVRGKSRLAVHPAPVKGGDHWQAANKLAVQSGAALVFDQGAGDALYQKNAHAVAPIASISKLMTAMVVLDATPDLRAPVSISEDDIDFLRGSRSRLNVGVAMPRETALLLALMSSENRAANALARHYPGGLHAFVQAMNRKAQSLGMRDTHFDDPTGLSSHNVSTAYDLAKLVSAAYRYPLIRELSTTSEARVDIGGRELVFRNTNPLVKNSSWDVGLSKTGYIHEAGKCLVMQARLADKPIVIVLLDSAGKLTRVGDAMRIKRWLESVHAQSRLPVQADNMLSGKPIRG